MRIKNNSQLKIYQNRKIFTIKKNSELKITQN